MPMVIIGAHALSGALYLDLQDSDLPGARKTYAISQATFREAIDPAFTLAVAMNTAMGRQEKHDVD